MLMTHKTQNFQSSTFDNKTYRLLNWRSLFADLIWNLIFLLVVLEMIIKVLKITFRLSLQSSDSDRNFFSLSHFSSLGIGKVSENNMFYFRYDTWKDTTFIKLSLMGGFCKRRAKVMKIKTPDENRLSATLTRLSSAGDGFIGRAMTTL